VPLVSRARSAASQVAREDLAKLLAPLTNRLIGNNDATFSQEQLNIPRAEAEHVIHQTAWLIISAGKRWR
jgi:hypothetical protein